MTKMIKDEDTSILEEIIAIEEGLGWPRVPCRGGKTGSLSARTKGQGRSLYQRHESMRQAPEGLQRVRHRVEDVAIGDLKRYLDRVQATRDAVVRNAMGNRRELGLLCTYVERAVNRYD